MALLNSLGSGRAAVSKPTTKITRTTAGLRCAAVSDLGMRRASNQDSLAMLLADDESQWRSRGHLFVVADGMGAHAAGELASQLATDNIPHTYQKRRDLPACEAIVAAVQDANGRIYAKGQNTVDFHGMGTTCSCLVLLPEGAVAAHVGDSRVYRLRGHALEQLTFDHSLVWEMAAAGQASEDEVPAYVPKNVITRSLGPHPTVKVDLEGPFPLHAGDKFLVCSDGLTGPLSPHVIGMILASLPPEDAADTLVDLANLLGGPDNITTVVAEISDPQLLGQKNGRGWTDVVAPIPNGGHSREDWAFGAALLLSLAAGALLAALDYAKAAVGCAAAAVAIAVAWALRRSLGSDGLGSGIRGSHGKAPYRKYQVAPSPQSIEMLSDIVRQLEDLEAQRSWPFDWQGVHADRHRAHKAIAAGDYPAAVVAYSSAVRRLMQAVRAHRPDPLSDSGINLG
ncbi:MAG: serine/threonine-protein phosphatase [Planctomycetota bacterium]|nr:MAG: serine/threonine-protein phosphatase [Planctomycetota bacterium]